MKNSSRTSVFVIFYILWATVPLSWADDISAGLGVGNAVCGKGEPSAAFRYDRDSDATPAHLNLTVGPGGSCAGQAVSVDFLVEARQYLRDKVYTFVGAGYDQRSVPFEYAPAAAKQFRGQKVETAQATFGIGFDGGDWYCQTSYNAVETRMVDGGTLTPVQATCSAQLLEKIELTGTTNVDTHAFDLTYDAGQISVSGSVSFGFSDLGGPAPGYITDESTGARYRQLGAPSTLYSVQLLWNF